jgi:3-phytase
MAKTVRVATFNVSLYGRQAGEILQRLGTGSDSPARHVAEIIQRGRPDVLLLNEVDYDPQGDVLRTFCEKYLAVGQNVSNSPAGAAEPISFPHRFIAPSNTGRHSGFDLDRSGGMNSNSGSDAYAGDCWGYGRYEGQYAFAILSKFPIDEAAIRTFQNFRWKDMPDAQLPDDPATPVPADWYGADALEKFPLSSKNHCDVPITIDGHRIHLLASHPTPPVFDGPEDRNGHRNHDEIRFWIDYVSSESSVEKSHSVPSPSEGRAGEGGEAFTRRSYIYDDNHHTAHLLANESFIILGDLNGDPHDGDGSVGIAALLAAPRVLKYPPPESPGAAEQARLQGPPNDRHRGEPRQDTIDAADGRGPGNLRIDHVLPSADLNVTGSGVFWPESTDPLFKLVGVEPFPSSDHRLVWVDVVVSDQPSAVSDQPGPANVLPADR